MTRFIIKCAFIVVFGTHYCDAFSGSLSGLLSSPFSSSSGNTSPFSKKLWDKDYLTSRVTLRLVKKSWIPKGMTNTNGKCLDSYPGSLEEAYKILRVNGKASYDYFVRPLSKSMELFTEKRDSGEPEYDKNLDSIFIIHPLLSHADEPFIVKNTLTALAMRNLQRCYNIFIYHYPQLKKNIMVSVIKEGIGAKMHYEEFAEVLASFIVKGVQQGYFKPSQIHFFGDSYSSNLAGYMARFVKFSTKNKIGSVMALDPYSAQYNENLIPLNKRDAEVVHILHSASYSHGTRERIGHADFVFNSGFLQPECSGFTTVIKRLFKGKLFEPFFCSHTRVVTRFYYVILYPSKFQARQCDTWPLFKDCYCEDRRQTFITFPIANRGVRGTFYLRTSGTWPYGLGEESSHCSPEAKKKYEKLTNM